MQRVVAHALGHHAGSGQHEHLLVLHELARNVIGLLEQRVDALVVGVGKEIGRVLIHKLDHLHGLLLVDGGLHVVDAALGHECCKLLHGGFKVLDR